MHSENRILMKAPLDKIFETAADLSRWPEILPHYRYVNYLERGSDRHKVVMAAKRKWIPIKWTSIEEIDRANREVHFYHLKAFTKGMHVIWTFARTSDGVEVKIVHNLDSGVPVIGGFISEQIIAKFFIHYVANQTLTHMKRYVEEKYGS